MNNELSLFIKYGVSVSIGILIGMQREYASENKKIAAGIRTFAIMALLGCISAHLSQILSSCLPLIAILIIVGSYFSVYYFHKVVHGKLGLTTCVTALLTIMIGALVYFDHMTTAVAVSVMTTVLLLGKLELHTFVHHMREEDIYAAIKFAVITAIILPVLPNQPFLPAPFDILNPFKIWLLVVFISGISFTGYILIKIIGTKKGMGLTGFLGGIASSTAVTLCLAQRSLKNSTLSKSFALAIILSWTVMFFRVLIEVFVLNLPLLRLLLLPILVSSTSGLIYCFYLYFKQEKETKREEMVFSNPFELSPAIKFGLIFIVILIVSKTAQLYFGNTGIYISSILGGLADVDAIALSMAQLSKEQGALQLPVAAKAIVLAAVSNTFSKGIIVMAVGSSTLRKWILPGYILIVLTGVVMIFLI